jgi:hypothetical protein
MQFWSGDNPVEASDGCDGQVRVVQQTEEGHSLSCTPMGVAENQNAWCDPVSSEQPGESNESWRV